MLEDNREGVFDRELEYAFISLISDKINVLIVGGGKAGFIKARSFLKRGCSVSVLAKNFDEKFENISSKSNLQCICDSYNIKYILDKHLIIIATDNEELNKKIREDCEKHYKIYLYSSSFKEGLFVTPVQNCTENIQYSIHTKSGSPRTSVFVSEMVKNELYKYDEFVGSICDIRNELKDSTIKNKVMNFVNTEDFYYFFTLGKHELVLKMFYGDDKFEITHSNAQK